MKIELRYFVCGLCLSFLPVLLSAEDALWPSIQSWVVREDGKQEKLGKEKKRELKKHWVEVSRDNFSKRVSTLGGAVDNYFSDDPEFMVNKSYARLRLTTIFEEQGETEFNSDFKLKADLPKSKNRFKFVLDSSPDEFESLESDDTNRPGQSESVEESSGFSAALRYSFKEWENFNGDMDVGIKAKIPLNPFIKFNFNRLFHLTEKWTMMWRTNVFYFHEDGAGADARLDFGRQVSPNFYFNNSVRAKWENKENFVQYSDVVSLSQQIDSRRILFYAAGLFYQEKPDEKISEQDAIVKGIGSPEELREGVSSYYVSVTYRKRMHEDWLFGEVTPSMNWYRQRDFDAVSAISFRVEVLFQQ